MVLEQPGDRHYQLENKQCDFGHQSANRCGKLSERGNGEEGEKSLAVIKSQIHRKVGKEQPFGGKDFSVGGYHPITNPPLVCFCTASGMLTNAVRIICLLFYQDHTCYGLSHPLCQLNPAIPMKDCFVGV